MNERIKYIINIVIVAMMLAAVTIQRDGRVATQDVSSLLDRQSQNEQEQEPIETTLDDGTRVINSKSLAKDIVGFGGRTPVNVYVKDEMIQKIEVQPNSETPSFLEQTIESGILDKWDGMTLAEAATTDVDVVSGATYTSSAIIGNIKRAAQWSSETEVDSSSLLSNIGLKDIAGILVILLGVFITLSNTKSKKLMTVHLALNVIILGFWCGSFLSLSTFTAWIGNGVNFSLGLISFTMLCVVIIVPMLGKKGSYCQLHCPMGSAQELVGRIPLTKITIPQKATKFLNNLRYYILAILLFVMWLGVGFELMNYEIFSAFIFSSASTAVLIMAAVFLILSLFIHRPYCRFVCPTGALITITQKTK